MVSNTTSFSDIQNNWSRAFITALAGIGVISGSASGTFRPDNSITRAEFAVILAKAFPNAAKKRQYLPFVDVPSNFWAASAIQFAIETGFLNASAGSTDNRFRPDNRVSRIELIVSLVTGLEIASKIKPDLLTALPQIYQDSVQIPGFARNQVAVATSAGLVSSFPNVKLLNPNLAATRADAAVFVYQALVYLKQAQRISSQYLVIPTPTPTPTPTPVPPTPTPTPPSTIRVNHRREFRGIWITTVWNNDWPSKPGIPASEQKAELIEILNRLQSLNFNAVILQVRPEGDAFYTSLLEPWSTWLTGTQGKAPEPFYDPLEFAIAECRKRNLELHAWFNPYRARTTTRQGSPNVRPHIAVTNPEVVYPWGNQLWMDPGAKIVQDRAYNVIIDVVRRYDIDGIHLDDYFYPYPRDGESFPDDKTYGAYRQAGGNLSLGDWRRDNVNQMVQRLSQAIKAASPFGIYRPGQPQGIAGLDAYDKLYADSKKWLEQGWIDYIAPQLYWRTDQTQQSYPALLKWWTEINTKKRHVYAGNNLAEPGGKSRETDEIEKQIKISRNQASNLSLGNIFFNLGVLMENRQGVSDSFKNSIYSRPALVPTTSWQNNPPPPAAPRELRVSNRRLSWQAGDNREVRSWTLYRQTGDSWTMVRVLSRGTTFATVEPGRYAVCAVDRFANESAGVVISVS